MSQSKKVKQLAHKCVLTILGSKSDIAKFVFAIKQFPGVFVVGEVHSIIGGDEFSALSGIECSLADGE